MLYVKALHIIFIVTWFAGLFYIVRLFIYHTEANDKTEPEKSILQNQYKVMEKRLWYGITWPSMIATFIFGWWLVAYTPAYLTEPWFLLKLCFVAGLLLYHLQCHVMFTQLQKDEIKYTSFKLRLWNEVATIFLVAIVFIIELRSSTSFIWGLLGLVIFSAALYAGIMIYRNNREKDQDK